MPQRPRIFTIPASQPFLPTLIDALARGRLVEGLTADDPLAFSRATLFLPTQRACRLARDGFLDSVRGAAAILPRIVALGDIDEDEIAFAEAATGDVAAEALALPEALGGLERRLLLAQLIAKWMSAPEMRDAGGALLAAENPAAALALADDLARLMDDMTTRQVPWEELDGLVPEHLDQYWQLTLRFLQIAREHWPAILRESDKMDPAARRDKLIQAEARRLASSDGPVIAAGSTGSIPATAELIATIARLPHGAVVLPGLDTDLDDTSWSLIAGRKNAAGHDDPAPAPGHPQFAMQALLARIGVARDAVIALAKPAAHGRERLVSEAMRPAATSELWHDRIAEPDFVTQTTGALASLACVEAANAEDEALAAAVALREAVETAGKTAALVTPDRALARRVMAALGRWNIAADDSGGDALADTPAGILARLAAEAPLGGLAPVTLLALLKHPLLRLGAPEGAHTRAIAALERAVLRGPRPKAGSVSLARALATFRGELAKLRRGEESSLHRSEPRTNLTDSELDAAADLVQRLGDALAPLEAIGRAPKTLNAFAAAHIQVLAALSKDDVGVSAAFADATGDALNKVFDNLAASDSAARLELAPTDYPEFFHAAMSESVVRRPGLPGVRVRILGTIEARLTDADRVVLSGLNEGTWPPEARTDAWLSRPMRHSLGLDLPERRIGLSAHDFAQMLGAKEVILTRAAKLAGAPTVGSRFVQRLAAVAGEARWKDAVRRGDDYLHWARALDAPDGPPRPATRPNPKPERNARPTRLTVTEIEAWLRDPYSIYAKHILRLAPLDAIDTPPGARDRGTVIHAAIGEFTKNYAAQLPDDVIGTLIKIGEKHFATLEDFPEAKAFWWPRYLRIARWFAGFEAERRAGASAISAEIGGELEIPLGERTFTLSARADRIERLKDGRYAILDYKTGQTPTAPQVSSGLAPQLTLEGAILRAGKFETIPAVESVAELVYVALRGGEPPGIPKVVEFRNSTPDAEIAKALARLTDVAKKFENPNQEYQSNVRPMFLRRGGGDYDHLARVKEWSLSGGAGDDTEDAE
jgi:ATP-dependent helicase/nuclease subunit B